MSGVVGQVATQIDQQLTASQKRVYASMVELLGRAGLDYQGDFVDAGGYRIHYLEYGSGPTVLLVHGGGAGCAMWFRQIAELSKHFRVIAPDNPIFGLSSRPASAQLIPNVTTGFLESFMDARGIDNASMAGLSMGGFACARLASERPDRVNRLVLLDAAGFGRELPWGFRLSAMPVLKYLLTRPQRWAHEKFFATTEVVNPNAVDNDAYLEYAFQVTAMDGHSLSVRENLPVFAGVRGQRNLLRDAELAAISAETLVIWGEQDRFFPLSHAHRAQSFIPNARLEVLAECGHVSILDQPQRVTDLLSGFFSAGSGAEAITGRDAESTSELAG